MKNRYSVVDEWGRKVGEFIPEGNGLESVIVTILVVPILWIIGFTAYFACVTTIQGFRLLREGKVGRPEAWWTITLILGSVLLSLALLFSLVTYQDPIVVQANLTNSIIENEVKAYVDSKSNGVRFSVVLENNGEHTISLRYVSDYQTGYASTPGCWSADKTLGLPLYKESSDPVLYFQDWFTYPNSDSNGGGFQAPYTKVTYSCILNKNYEEVYKEGVYLWISIYNKTSETGEEEIGSGWKKIR